LSLQRKIIFHKNHFIDFYDNQPEKVQEKIEYVLMILKTVQFVPKIFLTHISGEEGLYEIRVEFESNIYRIFCCFDQGDLILLFNGFQKKSQKTPRKEIRLARTLKNEYFNLKNN
jgi:phage-related protein